MSHTASSDVTEREERGPESSVQLHLWARHISGDCHTAKQTQARSWPGRRCNSGLDIELQSRADAGLSEGCSEKEQGQNRAEGGARGPPISEIREQRMGDLVRAGEASGCGDGGKTDRNSGFQEESRGPSDPRGSQME